MLRRLQLLGLMVGLVVAVSACGGDSEVDFAAGTHTETSSSSSSALAATGAEPSSVPESTATTGSPSVPIDPGLGLAMNISDTTDLDDSPLDKGEVLAFGPQAAPAMLESFGLDADSVNAHSSFVVTDAALTEFEGLVAVIDDGTFPLVGEPGWLYCLANSWPAHQAGPPFEVIGCGFLEPADAQLPGDGQVIVGFGEGGVQVGFVNP